MTLEGRSRVVPVDYYKREIGNLKKQIKELEEKVYNLQALVYEYQWVLGLGEEEKDARR